MRTPPPATWTPIDPPIASWHLPSAIRQILRRSVRAGLRLARHGPLKRPLSRFSYRPAAAGLSWGLEVVRWRGLNVAVNPGEAHGFHVYFLGDYASAEIEACVELCRDGDWFADIGANIGLVSLAVARRRPHVQVLAVEPDPNLCDWLRYNVSLNPDLAARVHILQAAATDRDDVVRFLPSQSPLNVGVGQILERADPGATDVRGLAIGRHAESNGRRLGVVKIDVEGAELAAVRGVWTGRSVPRGLVIETHAFSSADPGAFNRAILDELTSHGYVVTQLDRGRWIPVRDADDVGPRGHLRGVLPAAVATKGLF
jgi:FkbM family methyltransferase